MNKTGTFVSVAVVAGAFATAAVGGPPPPIPAHIGITHQRPVAGQIFTAVTVTPGDDPLTLASTVCAATLHGSSLHTTKRSFYDGDLGIIAITCASKIPASAKGSFRMQVTVTGTTTEQSPWLAWRIKH